MSGVTKKQRKRCISLVVPLLCGEKCENFSNSDICVDCRVFYKIHKLEYNKWYAAKKFGGEHKNACLCEVQYLDEDTMNLVSCKNERLFGEKFCVECKIRFEELYF